MELPIWLDHGKEVIVKSNPNALRLEPNQSRLVFNSFEAKTIYEALLKTASNAGNTGTNKFGKQSRETWIWRYEVQACPLQSQGDNTLP